VLLALSLDLQEGDEAPNLILDPLETDECRELLLELRERARRISWFNLLKPIGRRTKRPPNLLTHEAKPQGDVFKWVAAHGHSYERSAAEKSGRQ
jgi:hypothetical protein